MSVFVRDWFLTEFDGWYFTNGQFSRCMKPAFILFPFDALPCLPAFAALVRCLVANNQNVL